MEKLKSKLDGAKVKRMPRKSVVDPTEDSETKFKRLAGARMKATLKRIAQLGKLNAHPYKHEKRSKRFKAMKQALFDAIENALPEQATVDDPTNFEFED